jgi:putative phosphoribosyl transferase
MSNPSVERYEPPSSAPAPSETGLEVPVLGGTLGASLYTSPNPRAAIIVAFPSAIARLSSAERFAAHELAESGFTTLLVDLLLEDEDAVRTGAHVDVGLQSARLRWVTQWVATQPQWRHLPLGLVGVECCGAAALVATANDASFTLAVVIRGGNPDMAGRALVQSVLPTLFLVAPGDSLEMTAHQRAAGLFPQRALEIVPSQSRRFSEGPALDRATALSAAWFTRWLCPSFPT